MSILKEISVTAVVKNCGSLLEGPHWHVPSQSLYFVDITGNSVHCYIPTSGSHERVDVGMYDTQIYTTKSTTSMHLVPAWYQYTTGNHVTE